MERASTADHIKNDVGQIFDIFVEILIFRDVLTKNIWERGLLDLTVLLLLSLEKLHFVSQHLTSCDITTAFQIDSAQPKKGASLPEFL